MNQCPQCEGRKRITLTVTEIRPGRPKKVSENEIKCVECDGTGTVSDAQLRARERARAMWCRCDEPHEPHYVPDGAHPEVSKHHWRCGSCDGVTQVG